MRYETGVETNGGLRDEHIEANLNQLLTQLHQLTGAKIAANPHPTGNSKLGGNWKLTQLIPPSAQTCPHRNRPQNLQWHPGFRPQSRLRNWHCPPVVNSNLFNGDGKIGDFNSDGKPDVVVANLNSNTASILLNTTPAGATSPTFATRATFPTGRGPISVSVGDFNGDGKPDLATVNLYNSTASILLNTTPTGATTPTFTTQVPFATGPGPRSVSIADFNADGKPDLVAVNYDSNTVSILFNTTATGATTPSFAPQALFATATRPYFGSIGDFNGDGKPDLAVGNLGSANVSILLNTTTAGAATPSFAPQVPFPTGSGPWGVSIGDFNSDGKSDLAVSNVNDKNVSILLNTTTGSGPLTFTPQVTFGTGTYPFSASIGDFNGDSKPDLAAVNANDNNLSILLNTTVAGSTTPSFAPQVLFPAGTYPYFVSIADINSDGKPDLSVTNFGSSTASILLNSTPKISIAAGTTPTETGPTTGTFNITLDTPAPAGGLVINFDTTGSTAATPGHYSLTAGTNITAITAKTFTIAAGQTTAVINAIPVDDAIVNPGETVKVNVTPDPSNFNYFIDPVVANRTATLTITDNDFPTVNLSVSPTTATETGSPAITVTATASQAVVGTQTVNVALSGTATAADFTGTIPTNITIPDGKTTGSFTININDDALVSCYAFKPLTRPVGCVSSIAYAYKGNAAG